MLLWDQVGNPSWLRRFTAQTGCRVTVDHSADLIGAPQRVAGADVVWSRADAYRKLATSGAIAPLNLSLVPSWVTLMSQLKDRRFGSVRGIRYAIPVQWTAEVLQWNPARIRNAPQSWQPIYDLKFRNRITAPDDPMNIATAALYVSGQLPDLHIKQPFELTPKQFTGVLDYLNAQQPLIRAYSENFDEAASLLGSGGVDFGYGSLGALAKANDNGHPALAAVPVEGVTGFVDTLSLARRAVHPVCGYKFLNYVLSARVQAALALRDGLSPVTAKAQKYLQPRLVPFYFFNVPEIFSHTFFWHIPYATCESSGERHCVPYSVWASTWEQIRS